MTKIALIGCGKQAPKHIAGLRAAGASDILLYDLDAARAAALAEKEKLAHTADLDALFADPAVAIVDIATPTPSHAPLIGRAIEAGKHFFCEKPLCASLAEAQHIQAAANARGVIGMVGYIYRFAPVFEAGFKLTPAAGAPLGKPVTAHFRIGGRGEHEVWKHTRATGGGAANEMLVHMLDLAIWYFGAVRGVEVIANDLLRPVRTIGGKQVEVDAQDFVLVKLDMEHCGSVYVQADLVTPAFNQYTEIQYERGGFMGSIQGDVSSYVFATAAGGDFPAGRTALDNGDGNLFKHQMGALLAHVRRGEQPPRNSIDDSVKLMEAMNMLQQKGVGR